MPNRRLPNWGYKGRPPRTKGTAETSSEGFAGPHTHEENYMLKTANQFDYPQENLLQYLDKQFYTSGSSWTDQTGNGYDATFYGTISQSTTYGGTIGSFYFAQQQTSNYLNMGTGYRNLSSASAWSMVFVCRATFGSNRYGLSISTNSTDNQHLMTGSNNWITWLNGTTNTTNTTYYQMLVYSYNGTNAKLYESRNGATQNIGGAQNDIRVSGGQFILNQEQDGSASTGFTFDANQSSAWYISAFMLYNEVISAQDIADLEGYFAGIYPIERL